MSDPNYNDFFSDLPYGEVWLDENADDDWLNGNPDNVWPNETVNYDDPIIDLNPLDDNGSNSNNNDNNSDSVDNNILDLQPHCQQRESVEGDLLFPGRSRSPKRKIALDTQASDLKSAYYATFTYKKSFPKENLLKIHNLYLSPQLGLKKMTRNETRQKDLYFQNYASQKDQILQCLKKNKDAIFSTILKSLKKKKR